MLRLTLAALAAVLIAAACAGPAVAAPPPATPEGVPVPALDWRDCEDGFECATATVPRDYARPHGGTVELALVRRPAIDREHRIGTLFLNPGGPGDSGVDFIREAPPGTFGLLPKFDWVGFDPRGVGSSEPAVDCDELAEPFAPMTPETFDLGTLVKRSRSLARLCQNQSPAFLASLTTANVARDLDVLRAAVGDRKLTYLGLSWGGMLGETYASLFPGRARALLLDSPVDGDVWLNDPLATWRERGVSGEDVLDRFLAACAEAGEDCPFRGDEDALDDLLARLDATPLQLPGGRSVDGHAVRSLIGDALYSKLLWSRLADLLAAADAGDRERLAALLDARPPLFDELLLDAFASYTYVEQRNPRRLGAYVEHAEHHLALAPHLPFSGPHFSFGVYENASARFWPIRPRGAFYGPFRHAPGATPALVIAGTHDPATPYAWGKRVVRDLGNARLLTYRGTGHGAVTEGNPCVLAHTIAYLEELELPPAGATCEQAIDPFAAAQQRRRWRN